MAEVLNYVFSLKEVVELLIKKQDIHEGNWTITAQFGFTASNVGVGPGDPNMAPAAVNIIQKIGIQKIDQTHPAFSSSVDASKVNPISKKKK